jgi:predicted AAA+ superfamily ATPase
MAQELAISQLVVANYFDILEDLLLSRRPSPFTYRSKCNMIAHQKFYFFDAGLYKALRKVEPGDSDEELAGAALETLFLQSMSSLNDYLELDYTINFWRTISGNEVDFVMHGSQGFHAFEIKHSKTITARDLKGLKAFAEDYPEAHLHLLYRGEHTLYFQNITAIPFEKALQEIPNILQGKQKP